MDSSSESAPSDREEEQPAWSLPLPAAFLQFLGENGLDPMPYSVSETIPWYIRDGGRDRKRTQVRSPEGSMAADFYAIPPEVQIAESKAYPQGKVLVDAECTHDGSINKFRSLSSGVENNRSTCARRTTN